MEERKELGMGWYNFLKNCTFGWFIPFAFFINLGSYVNSIENEDEYSKIFLLMFAMPILIDVVFKIIIRIHLKAYSNKIVKMFFYYLIVFNIITYLPAFVSILFYPEEILNIVFDLIPPIVLYLINRVYFKNRSHIFTNNCNFFGKIISSKGNKTTTAFDSTIAIANVQKIKSGKEAELSVGQITTLLINLQDAKNNLNEEEYKEINELYNSLRKNTTKKKMNGSQYLENCFAIIRCFDKIAPYEKYCGGDASEFSILMDEIRNAPFDDLYQQTNNKQYEIHNNFCRKCGAKLNEDSNFCHKCGAEVVNLEELNK